MLGRLQPNSLLTRQVLNTANENDGVNNLDRANQNIDLDRRSTHVLVRISRLPRDRRQLRVQLRRDRRKSRMQALRPTHRTHGQVNCRSFNPGRISVAPSDKYIGGDRGGSRCAYPPYSTQKNYAKSQNIRTPAICTFTQINPPVDWQLISIN